MLNKNIIYYLLSNTLVVFCSNMIQFLLAIYVLRETKSATLFSLMLSIIVIPRLFVSPIAGVISDKTNKILLMRLCLFFYFVTYLLFSLLEAYAESIYIIMAVVILLEMIEIFYTSANTSMIPILAKSETIAKITSMSVTMESISNILAPVIGAICLNSFGFQHSLFLTSVISGVCLVIFLFIREINYLPNCSNDSAKQMLFEALILLKNNHFIFCVVLIAPLINFFLATLLTITYVYYLNNILDVSPIIYGIFEGGCGISAIIGGLLATFIISSQNHLKTLCNSLKIISLFVFFQMIIVILMIPHNITFIIFFICAILINISLMVMNAATSVAIKQMINVEYMGRITMIINLLATISLPVGQLLYGHLSDKYPIYIAFLISEIGLLGVILLLKGILKDE